MCLVLLACVRVSFMRVSLTSVAFLSRLFFFVLWVFVAQVVCAFWGFVFLGWFLGCLVVVCGGCFLVFGVCRGFCFVGVVVFWVSFCFVDVVVLFVLFFGVWGGVVIWGCVGCRGWFVLVGACWGFCFGWRVFVVCGC